MRAKTDVAKQALKNMLLEDAQDAANTNSLVSKTEAKNLDPANRKAELQLREEGGKGTRVKAGQIAERAFENAEKVWDKVNTKGKTMLSQAEVKTIGKKDPTLGQVTQDAYLQARGLGGPKVDNEAIKASVETIDFSHNGMGNLRGAQRIDAREGQAGRAKVPQKVLTAFDHYHRAEQADFAGVALHKISAAGQKLFAVTMNTDGSEGHVELFKKDGSLVAGGRLMDGQLLAWDEFPGRTRISESLLHLDNPRYEDGLSEAPERIAAGQVPLDWNADVTLNAGRVYNGNGWYFDHVELPAGVNLNADQQKALYAAMALLWGNTFQPRLNPGEESQPLGGNMGVLKIGEFTRPDDGQKYLVADWRDIDDNSQVFYFQKNDASLRFAINQYDN